MSLVTCIRIDLQTVEPFAVAQPEARVGNFTPVSRDPSGVVIVPASGLAGSLRQHLRASGENPGAWMGSENPLIAGRGVGSLEPSRLRLLGTAITGEHLEVRARTAIDRSRGAAAEQKLRSAEEVAPGAMISLFLEFEGQRDNGLERALASWQPFIGGRRSVGCGAAVVRVIRIRTFDLAVDDDLVEMASRRGPGLFGDDVLTDLVPIAPSVDEPAPFVERVFSVDRVRVGGGTAERDNGTPIAACRMVNGRPVIDGSTWKGIFRSRAEFILRSLGGDAAACEGADEPCGRCAVCRIFGHVGVPSVLRFRSSSITGGAALHLDHIAIDRITGGAATATFDDDGVRNATGLKFEESVWEGGTVELRIDCNDQTVPDGTSALLLAVIRDIEAGYLGVGASTARGLGTLRGAAGQAAIDDVGGLAQLLAEAGDV